MYVCVCNVFTDRQKQAGVKRAKVVQRVAQWERMSKKEIERAGSAGWGARSSTRGCPMLMKQAGNQEKTQQVDG